MKQRSLLLWFAGAGSLVGIIGVACWHRGAQRDSEAARNRRIYDEPFQQEITKSDNLAADRERMWRAVPGVGVPAADFEVSPVSAINAASRVFATVTLKGKTAQGVAQALGAQPRPRYGYNFPFYPTDNGVLVYRFDCGNFGWQFNIFFDAEGKVEEVKRQGIE